MMKEKLLLILGLILGILPIITLLLLGSGNI